MRVSGGGGGTKLTVVPSFSFHELSQEFSPVNYFHIIKAEVMKTRFHTRYRTGSEFTPACSW